TRLARQRLVTIAAAFLQSYPIGTTVQGDGIVAWARDHADGLIASDLLIDRPSLQLSALRRRLNMGGASVAEAERFWIDIVDSVRKVFAVRALRDACCHSGSPQSSRGLRPDRLRGSARAPRRRWTIGSGSTVRAGAICSSVRSSKNSIGVARRSKWRLRSSS